MDHFSRDPRAGNGLACARTIRFRGAVGTVARARPLVLLELWERFGPRATLPCVFAGAWPDLLRPAPEKTVALACRALAASPRQSVPRAMLRAARDLPERALFQLAKAVAPVPELAPSPRPSPAVPGRWRYETAVPEE